LHYQEAHHGGEARRRIALEAQIASLRADLEGEEEDLEKQAQETTSREDELRTNRAAMASARRADTGGLLERPPSIETTERGLPSGDDATTSRRPSS
jgi:hypothetical protein